MLGEIGDVLYFPYEQYGINVAYTSHARRIHGLRTQVAQSQVYPDSRRTIVVITLWFIAV